MSNKEDSSSSSSLDISGDDYLKVLICSANVGNAEPTSSSFAAWVPSDGEITSTLRNTKYPVTSNEVNLAIGPYGSNSNIGRSENNSELSQEEIIKLFTDRKTNDDSDNNGGDDGQYDIIVLGMQEAAFVSKKSVAAADNNNVTTSTTERSAASQPFGNDDSERVADATDDNNNVNNNNCNSGEANNSNELKKKHKKGVSQLFKSVNKAGMMVRGVSANQTYKRNPSLRSNSHSETDNTTAQKNLEQRINMLGYDSNTLQTLIKEQCPSYEIVTSNLRGEMRLYVLAHHRVANDISDVYCAAENTGIGSIMANKGGIIVTLTFSNMTRLSFMTCHLEAHEGQNHYNNRNKNLAEILNGAKTDPVYNMQDATIISHHMFLCGDLNYRINFDNGSGDGVGPGSPGKKKSMSVIKKQMAKGTKLIKRSSSVGTEQQGEADAAEVKKASELLSEESYDESNNGKGGGGGEKEAANGSHFDQAKALVEAEDWAALNSGDELAMALKQKECLVGFSTLPCHWPPTFKVGRGEGYQYNEKRTPSYTDRILWKSADGMVNNVIPLLYEPCPEFITSDHKPIRGGFAVKLNKSQNVTTSKSVPQKQIQVLVSDMKCTNLPIMDSELIGGLSDPYVLFVSSPKELLYSKAWPATSIITRNLNPVWDEDMHLTMDAKGMRDGCLAEGSMLTLTVMDFDATSGDDVIGSVALNLNELCSELDLSGPSSDKVQETIISRPILRNGQEYGMLECKLKTAFLAPKEVKSFLAGAKNVRTACNISLKSKLVAALKAK